MDESHILLSNLTQLLQDIGRQGVKKPPFISGIALSQDWGSISPCVNWRTLDAYQATHGIVLPPDLQEYYTHTRNGMTFNWGLNSGSGSKSVGRIHLYPFNEWTLHADTSNQNARASPEVFLLLSITSTSKFYLEVTAGKSGQVWREPLGKNSACRISFTDSFTRFYRLQVAHAGVHGWECGAGADGRAYAYPWSTRNWLTYLGISLPLANAQPSPQIPSSHLQELFESDDAELRRRVVLLEERELSSLSVNAELLTCSDEASTVNCDAIKDYQEPPVRHQRPKSARSLAARSIKSDISFDVKSPIRTAWK